MYAEACKGLKVAAKESDDLTVDFGGICDNMSMQINHELEKKTSRHLFLTSAGLTDEMKKKLFIL